MAVRSDEEKTQYARPAAMSARCPHCGYDLRASLSDDGAMCPECGVHSRKSDIQSPLASNIMPTHRMLMWMMMPGVVVSIAAGCAGLFDRADRLEDSTIMRMMIVSGVVSFALSILAGVRLQAADRPHVGPVRRAVTIAWYTGIVFGIGMVLFVLSVVVYAFVRYTR